MKIKNGGKRTFSEKIIKGFKNWSNSKGLILDTFKDKAIPITNKKIKIKLMDISSNESFSFNSCWAS